MPAPQSAKVTPSAPGFVEETTIKTLLAIPDEALDAVMAVAFQLYQAGRYAETEVLCGGLIGADQKCWWSYALYAATLRRLGRTHDALAQLEIGLFHAPSEAQLLSMHREVREAIAAGEAGETPSTPNAQAAAWPPQMRRRRVTRLGRIASVPDRGEIVKDMVDTALPKELEVAGDLAGGATDVVAGNAAVAESHALAPLPDPRHAAEAVTPTPIGTGGATKGISGQSAGSHATPSFEPPPPTRGPQVTVTVSGGELSITINETALRWPRLQAAIDAVWLGSVDGSAHGASPAVATRPSAAPVSADAAFMHAIRDGKISPDVARDPGAMQQIQERMKRITHMNQLMSQMLAAMHQTAMSTTQNISA
jgi:hypothetical protein